MGFGDVLFAFGARSHREAHQIVSLGLRMGRGLSSETRDLIQSSKLNMD